MTVLTIFHCSRLQEKAGELGRCSSSDSAVAVVVAVAVALSEGESGPSLSFWSRRHHLRSAQPPWKEEEAVELVIGMLLLAPLSTSLHRPFSVLLMAHSSKVLIGSSLGLSRT